MDGCIRKNVKMRRMITRINNMFNAILIETFPKILSFMKIINFVHKKTDICACA